MSRTGAHYEFGDFALDVGEQCLLRRDTGQTILLTAKVFETLLYFVEHAGETLDKDVLLSSIWPGVVVEENSLTQNVSTLRQMLGETRGDNRYIATVARKGYRFVAKVSLREEPMSSNAAHRPRIPLAAGVAVLIAVIAAITFFVVTQGRHEAAPPPARTL